MNIERERKFLVVSNDWRSAAHSASELRQAYIAVADDRTLRVRKSNDRAWLTLKVGRAALSRQEYEYSIPLADAENMMQMALGREVRKMRHLVRHGDLIFEVDEFAGDLQGLVLAEFETPDGAQPPDRPAWLGREVTGDSRYYNSALALDGLPTDVDDAD